MHVVKFALLLILVFILSMSCVFRGTLQNFSTFYHISFEAMGIKKETKGTNFLSDIDILTPPLRNIASVSKTFTFKLVT